MSDGNEMKPADGAFHGKSHYFPLRVYFEDTDLAAIVYHANYLRFMERARSDMLRAAGIDQRAAVESGEGVYAVAELSIRYRGSAKLGDDLIVVTDMLEVRAASVVIQQRVMRGEEVLTDARIIVAFLTPEGRPKRQPRPWVEMFERLRGEGET
jgi:acyl-CoA thioester hydrolase